MAIDYLTIPATSVDVERLFSRGRLVLSHVRNRLSAQTTCAILCVGAWSVLGLVKPEDARKVAELDDIEGDEDVELEDGWDRIY
uniref:Homeobox domain-containing protein n=1 Tax=Ganoderma boninense TaxID=34458 RepID=A0A5K1JW08_9APHY|nr:Homeobox domain-containing protein [Ganoderma boninense]